MLATVLHMLQGTPYIYQEEIGMTNPHFHQIDDYRCGKPEYLSGPSGATVWQPRRRCKHYCIVRAITAAPPCNGTHQLVLVCSQGTPWIPLSDNHVQINVSNALADKNSVFYHYQQLIQLRKQYPIIVEGNYQICSPITRRSGVINGNMANKTARGRQFKRNRNRV